MHIFAGEDSDVYIKKQAIQKAAKGKVSGAMKRAIAKKKAKKTTELLAPLTR